MVVFNDPRATRSSSAKPCAMPIPKPISCHQHSLKRRIPRSFSRNVEPPRAQPEAPDSRLALLFPSILTFRISSFPCRLDLVVQIRSQISDRHALCAFLTWLYTNDWQGDFPDKYRAVGIDKIRSPQQLHLTPNFVAFTRERAAFRHWPERTKPLELPLARF
jgi:hypothetical protein